MTRPTIKGVIATVATSFNLDVDDLRGPHRSPRLVWPRQVAMYLAWHMTGRPLALIGQKLNRHHTTVLFGVQKVQRLRATDARVAVTIDALIGCVRAGQIATGKISTLIPPPRTRAAFWSPASKTFLLENWRRMSDSEIAGKIGRSIDGVAVMRRGMRLLRRPGRPATVGLKLPSAEQPSRGERISLNARFERALAQEQSRPRP